MKKTIQQTLRISLFRFSAKHKLKKRIPPDMASLLSSTLRQPIPIHCYLISMTLAGLIISHPEESSSKSKSTAYEENLRRYSEQYHLTMPNPAQIEQLSAVQEHKIFTPQADVLYNGAHPWTAYLHRDVQRAVVGIHFLTNILNTPDLKTFYEQFSCQQPLADRLAYADFVNIQKEFKSCSSEEINGLFAAMVIQAVSLTERLVNLAKIHLTEPPPYDSVMFSGKTVQECPEIYSIWPKNLEAQIAVKNCFPYHAQFPQLHFRHIFYTEGNQGMYQHLRHLIVNQQITHQEFKIWRLFWLLDLIKFNGHVNPELSFLTRDVYAKYQAVSDELEQLFKHPDHNVLMGYLGKQAHRLNIDAEIQKQASPLSKSIILLMTHLALMLNIKPEEQSKLRGVLEGVLSFKDFEVISENYFEYCQKIQVTPTFQPAQLNNTYDYFKKHHPEQGEQLHIKQTLQIALPVIMEGLNIYSEKVRSLPEGLALPPLSFRCSAGTDCVEGFIKGAMTPYFSSKNHEMGCQPIITQKKEPTSFSTRKSF